MSANFDGTFAMYGFTTPGGELRIFNSLNSAMTARSWWNVRQPWEADRGQAGPVGQLAWYLI